MFTVEKNVPPPKSRPRCVGLYPWRTMKVGESFVVRDRIAAAAARGSFLRFQRQEKIPAHWKCVQAVEPDGQIRMWVTVED